MVNIFARPYEWVETIREAGEAWRELEDVEAVADEVGLSLEKTKEALTVYRLIFEEVPMTVASRAVVPGLSYFALEGDVVKFDPEDENESVEDLLREFVGAVYLEYNIEDEEIGEPPERETPPSGFEGVGLDLGVSGLLPSFEIPSSTVAAVADMPSFHDEVFQSQVSALANTVSPDLFQTEKMLASAIQPMFDQQVMAQSLVPLTAAIEEQQGMIGQSTGLAFSEAMQDIQFPEPILADLASIQPSVSAAAAAGSYPSPLYKEDESVVDDASTTSDDTDPLEATGEVVPETDPEIGPVDATVNSTLPDTGTFTTELVFEIPAMMVESILSAGQARTWFTNLPEDYQISAVRVMLAAIVFSFTRSLGWAALAALLAPGVRRMVLDE